MEYLKIKPDNTVHRDIDFLMKAPLLPNLYLTKDPHNFTLILYKPTEGDEWEPYILKTDCEHFLTSYRKYYEDRFEVTDLQTTEIPASYEKFFGKDNENSSVAEESEQPTE